MSDVRGFSVDQPWATLAALGLKRFETRTRPLPKTITPDTIILICSTTKARWQARPTPVGDHYVIRERWPDEPDRFHLSRLDQTSLTYLHLSAVVAVARFTGCLPIVEREWCEGGFVGTRMNVLATLPAGHPAAPGLHAWLGGAYHSDISDQLPYGHWTPGDFAYPIDLIGTLAYPVSVKDDGVHHQGFWRPTQATIDQVKEQVSW